MIYFFYRKARLILSHKNNPRGFTSPGAFNVDNGLFHNLFCRLDSGKLFVQVASPSVLGFGVFN